MAWTTPRTWTAGELVTANEMNTHLRDNLNILKTYIGNDGSLNGLWGTWTPVIRTDTIPSPTHTYATQAGGYTKFGRMVFCWFNVALSAKAGTFTGTYAQLGGFPFSIISSANIPGGAQVMWGSYLPYFGNFTSGETRVVMQMQESNTFSYLLFTAPTTYAAPADITNTTFMQGSFWYPADS